VEEWGKPPPPPPPRPPGPGTGGGQEDDSQPPVPPIGFQKAFEVLAARKRRELKGARWEAVKATEASGGRGSKAARRALDAEARRRAAAEMARRIERQTGKRPKESTIRRAARQDRTPRGVDQAKIDRQARIDAAGGIKPFAARAGVSQSSAAKWRDSGKSISGPIQVEAIVDGHLISNGESYPKQNVYAEGEMRPPAADALLAAIGAGDQAAVRALLGPFVAANADWQGEAERSFVVERIIELIINGTPVTGLG
jgi:hypothetical protein